MRPSVRRNPWTARANGTTVPDEKNDGRPTITRSLVFEGKSHEKPALFLLDTGAETCVVSLERVQKLRLYNKIVENPDNQQMATADGTESPIRGTIMLNYWIGDFTERRKFTVMKDCCYDFILGMPFFHKYAPEIDYENRTVMVGLFNEKEEHPEYWTLRTVDTEVFLVQIPKSSLRAWDWCAECAEETKQGSSLYTFVFHLVWITTLRMTKRETTETQHLPMQAEGSDRGLVPGYRWLLWLLPPLRKVRANQQRQQRQLERPPRGRAGKQYSRWTTTRAGHVRWTVWSGNIPQSSGRLTE